MKRFIAIICIIYSLIIGYVWIFGLLKNFLGPQMQIYIKISLFILLFIGVVLLLNRNITYKFRISDLLLLLPIIMIILAGDGRISTSLAKNRVISNDVSRTKSEVIETNEELEYNLSKIDIEVIDSNYAELGNYIPLNPKAVKFEGNTIKLSGFIYKSEFLPDGLFAIGKYLITCCTADANFVGFIVKYDISKIKDDAWYQIEGVLKKGHDKDGYDIMYIDVKNIEEIDSKSEEQYIYPCYYNGDGLCSDVTKYNLEY